MDNTSPHAITSSTLLPAQVTIPTSYIQLLDSFFRVVDSLVANPTNSEQFADIFTTDGIWKTPSAAFHGHDQLLKSGTTWEFLRTLKSFRHYVTKVYAVDAEGKDLMVQGWIDGETVDGMKGNVAFGANVDIEVDAQGKERLSFFQGWSSPGV